MSISIRHESPFMLFVCMHICTYIVRHTRVYAYVFAFIYVGMDGDTYH